MMDNMFIIAAIISVVYFIVKFVEMRFLTKDNKPLKLLFRDAIIVYLSTVMGLFLVDQLKLVKKSLSENAESTRVFTDNPDF
jgi:hypothetical protein